MNEARHRQGGAIHQINRFLFRNQTAFRQSNQVHAGSANQGALRMTDQEKVAAMMAANWTPGIEYWKNRAEAAEAALQIEQIVRGKIEARITDLRAKLAVAVEALEATRIVLAEHEPHPLPVLSQVLDALAQITTTPAATAQETTPAA